MYKGRQTTLRSQPVWKLHVDVLLQSVSDAFSSCQPCPGVGANEYHPPVLSPLPQTAQTPQREVANICYGAMEWNREWKYIWNRMNVLKVKSKGKGDADLLKHVEEDIHIFDGILSGNGQSPHAGSRASPTTARIIATFGDTAVFGIDLYVPIPGPQGNSGTAKLVTLAALPHHDAPHSMRSYLMRCHFTYLYISLHIFTYLYISLHIFTYLYISLHIFTYLYISLHIFTYLYISLLYASHHISMRLCPVTVLRYFRIELFINVFLYFSSYKL